MNRKIVLGLVLGFGFLQLFQTKKNQGSQKSPDDIHQSVPIPPVVSKILKQACYDCHSNLTNYPWYANLTPINWWIADHVAEGKAALNFSVFASYSFPRQQDLLEEIAETVKSDKMPLASYVSMHANAKLTMNQKILIERWASTARKSLSRRK